MTEYYKTENDRKWQNTIKQKMTENDRKWQKMTEKLYTVHKLSTDFPAEIFLHGFPYQY